LITSDVTTITSWYIRLKHTYIDYMRFQILPHVTTTNIKSNIWDSMPHQNRISFHFDILYIINMGEMCQRERHGIIYSYVSINHGKTTKINYQLLSYTERICGFIYVLSKELQSCYIWSSMAVKMRKISIMDKHVLLWCTV
jgi:hypothetical protein